MYATPGFHKEADAFNRVQRGHQNYFEAVTGVTVATLIAGLQYPIAASICNAFFSLGSVLYQAGYSDTKHDVTMARFKKGGAVKYIGIFGTLYMSINVAGKMLGWWGKGN